MNKQKYLYQDILRNFLDSYLVKRDAKKTISLVTDDIYSLGTGVQEAAHNIDEFAMLIESEMEQLNTPIHYSLDTYYEKQIAPGVISYMCDVTTRIKMEGQQEIQYSTRLTAGFRKEGDEYLAYHLHMSEASAIQQEQEFFPLHYGNMENHKIDEEEQMGLVELMKKMLPGGAMGGYVEPGFPLYFINDELLHWLGYDYEEFIDENGQMMANTMHPDDVAMVDATISECFESGNEYTVEYRMRKKDGTYIWVRDTGRKTITPGGRMAMISIIVDISNERKKLRFFEKTIESMKKEQRQFDRMTELLNREPAEILIDQSLTKNNHGALYLMDIDNFKLVNDAKGHPEGDKVLRTFADMIKRVFPEDAILARLGGDEFVAFLPQYTSIEQLQNFAEQVIEQSAELIEDPVLANVLGSSIGIALAPEDGDNFIMLYSSADKGQYYAKRNGKGRYSFYGQEPGLPVVRDVKANMDTLRRMVQSVQNDNGALLVEYEAFHKIYQFMERNVDRMVQNTQILLFTLQRDPAQKVDKKIKEEERIVLENAIQSKLRKGDLMMDFSATQIAVLLVNCDDENAAFVASRIMDSYNRETSESAAKVSYESSCISEVS
ncbi:MAG: diguanylate cyclase [Lachnospiraceae bacterium]|nr:diguanylate cyclase [Lachnospiraceae bacterium]MDD3616696.1 diguanylate cyclase [Lachnospiraceae bacterium]